VASLRLPHSQDCRRRSARQNHALHSRVARESRIVKLISLISVCLRGTGEMRMPPSTTLSRSAPSVEPNIGELVRDLRNLYYIAGIELMLRIGELILNRLYGGNVAHWQSRRKKDNSFRKLQRHPELPFKAAMLSRAVAIHLIAQRRGDLLTLRNVSPSHLQEVINVDPVVQDRLIAHVESERWSVQKLRTEVIGYRTVAESRGRRPRTIAFGRQLRVLKTVVDSALCGGAASVPSLKLDDARLLLDNTNRLCEQTESLRRMLANHVAALEERDCARAPTTIEHSLPPSTACIDVETPNGSDGALSKP
jgi:hypothetical protein